MLYFDSESHSFVGPAGSFSTSSSFANTTSTFQKKLRAEHIDPRIPWLYDYELDFRFR